MQRCTFCHEEIGSVHWAFDGVSEQPVPACRECCDRLRLKVWKVEAGGDERFGRDLAAKALALLGQYADEQSMGRRGNRLFVVRTEPETRSGTSSERELIG